MSNLKFTGGSVTFERNVKVADYESKKLAVTLNFGSDDTLTDEQLGQAADHCIRLVEEKLGLRKSAPAPQVAASPSSQQPVTRPLTGASVSSDAAPAATPPKRGPKKPPVVEVKIDPAEITEAVAARGNISSAPEDRTDPNNPEDVVDPSAVSDGSAASETPGAQTNGDTDAAAVVEGDPAAIEDDVFSAAPALVTDGDLVDAITKKNAAIKNPIAIRQLIGSFVQPPKQAKDIPPEQRASFIEKLNKL